MNSENKKTVIAVSLGCYDQALYTFWLEGHGKDESGKPNVEIVPVSAYMPHMGAITTLASNNNILVSGSSDETIKIYNLRKRAEIGRLDQHTGKVTHVSLSADGAHMISVGDDNNLCIWRTKDWECTKEIANIHKKGVLSLALHPSGLAAVTIGGDSAFRMWDLVKGRQVFVSKEFKFPSEVAWDKTGQKIAVACGRNLIVKDAARFADASVTLECQAQISSLEPLAAGKFAVGLANGTIMVWDVASATAKCVATLEGAHTIRVRGMAYYKDGASLGLSGGLLVTTSTDGRMVLWDSNKWTQVAAHETDSRITCAVCSSFELISPVVVVKDEDEDVVDVEDDDREDVDVKDEENANKVTKKGEKRKVSFSENVEEVDKKKAKKEVKEEEEEETGKKKKKKKNEKKKKEEVARVEVIYENDEEEEEEKEKVVKEEKSDNNNNKKKAPKKNFNKKKQQKK